MSAATIAAIATALPPFRYTLADAKDCLRRTMPLAPERIPAIEAIFEHAGVEQRYSPFPIEHLATPRPLDQISDEYREQAIALGRRAACDCLRAAGTAAAQVDFLITVSCTGLMLPSLDAYLLNDLGGRMDIPRLPITELGCAAGAAALARARDFIAAYPNATVLAVSVELSSLTFQAQDVSMANLVSCALFGDGAAAALVTGRAAAGLRILDSASHLFPQSYDALGFALKPGGLHIVLGKHLAMVLRSGIRQVVGAFLGRHGLATSALSFVVLHPGGKKLIEAVEEELGLPRERTQPSWDVLRSFGNLSSASVFFVLQEWLAKRPCRPGDLGLLLAFGPGFSVEMLLLQWG